MPTGPHLSRQRNPFIADEFNRTAAVEIWGRGTNRVIDECRRYGVEPPTFREEAGSLIVTFSAQLSPMQGPSRDQATGEVTGEVAGEVADEVRRLLEVLRASPLTRSQAQAALGLKGQANFRDRYLQPSLDMGLVEMTLPDKPHSSRQKYRLTEKGRRFWSRIARVAVDRV